MTFLIGLVVVFIVMEIAVGFATMRIGARKGFETGGEKAGWFPLGFCLPLIGLIVAVNADPKVSSTPAGYLDVGDVPGFLGVSRQRADQLRDRPGPQAHRRFRAAVVATLKRRGMSQEIVVGHEAVAIQAHRGALGECPDHLGRSVVSNSGLIRNDGHVSLYLLQGGCPRGCRRWPRWRGPRMGCFCGHLARSPWRIPKHMHPFVRPRDRGHEVVS
jgi:hypothetical protein